MNSSVHIDNRGKDILILGKGPTQILKHTLTAETYLLMLQKRISSEEKILK